MELTEAGSLLYTHALRMFDELQSATTSMDGLGKTVRGDVRIRLPTGLGHLYLTPLLLEFARSHPLISLKVSINDSIGDLISAEVDVAIKVTSQPPDDHVARKICDVDWCLCASTAFLDSNSKIRSVEDLQQCDLIAPQSLGRHFGLRVMEAGQSKVIRITPRIQSGDYRFLFEAMIASLGVALLPRYAVWNQLESGLVREVLDYCEPKGVGDSIYMITTPNRYPALATRTLMDFIREYLEEQAKSWQRRN